MFQGETVARQVSKRIQMQEVYQSEQEIRCRLQAAVQLMGERLRSLVGDHPNKHPQTNGKHEEILVLMRFHVK